MRHGRKDANHNELKKIVEQIPGLSLFDLADVGDGMTDWIIGYKVVNYLIEIKDGAKVKSARKLTDSQVEFHRDWKGQKAVCKNLDEILVVIGIKTGA